MRVHKDKLFSKIYDMVVIPDKSELDRDSMEMEKGIVKSELMRVYDFASSAMNKYQSLKRIEDRISDFGIDIFSESSIEV